ncbi:hypothetical protein N7447_004691 [Penicillium robsamsonii]|uniref:uncharacterized protein n=1 Tax=Penicillium robsamsonii TaxID=1792511 RepID=UPI00254955D4|nr:uncharacterized protein N7447_004691 [Penicillium robsamsonii]KAJ5822351.1 hypothetical protein N7447_004691 [Penicillium robsamsonii]
MFTTATLSPSALEGIILRLSLPDSPKVIRASINKPNLYYGVCQLPPKGGEDAALRFTYNRVLDFIQHNSPPEGPRAQAICFFLYKNQVDRFAEDYNESCAAYHAGLSLEARALNLALFTSNSKPILAATSAIGAGFNFDNVGLIIYFQGCWSLTDFVQGCGRAARAPGAIGFIEVLTRADGKLPSDRRSGDLSKDSQELTLFHEWVQEGICRRRLLHTRFNPRASSINCSGEDRLCDLCLSRAQTLAKQAEKAKAILLQQKKRLEALKIYISQWYDGCCIGCLVDDMAEDVLGEYIYISRFSEKEY